MPNPPVLQGHWRLLEPDEVTEAGDQIWFVGNWIAIDEGGVGWLQKVFDNPIRRRVAPLPKCETCSLCAPDSADAERRSYCIANLRLVRPNDYCSRHPQAQEATR